jgi:hypothetical protein
MKKYRLIKRNHVPMCLYALQSIDRNYRYFVMGESICGTSQECAESFFNTSISDIEGDFPDYKILAEFDTGKEFKENYPEYFI